MIKRKYFYNIKWNHNDGKQSYSYINGVVTHTSLLRDDKYIYNHVIKDAKNHFEDKFPNGSIEVISFNRI